MNWRQQQQPMRNAGTRKAFLKGLSKTTINQPVCSPGPESQAFRIQIKTALHAIETFRARPCDIRLFPARLLPKFTNLAKIVELQSRCVLTYKLQEKSIPFADVFNWEHFLSYRKHTRMEKIKENTRLLVWHYNWYKACNIFIDRITVLH
jgi:hypothetical protein